MLQFGSYELAPVDVVIIGLVVYIIGKFVRRWFRAPVQKPDVNKCSTLKMRDFTKEEFEQFKEEESDRFLVVNNGEVFDLTKSRHLWEANKQMFDNATQEIIALLHRKYPFVGRIVKTPSQKRDSTYDGRYAVPYDQYSGI